MHSYEKVVRSKELKAQGLTDQTISQMLEVSVRAIRHWRYGTRQALHPDQRRYGSRNSSCALCTDKLLYLRQYSYLLGLYLGDGHIVSKYRHHTLAISCDDAYPGLKDAAERALQDVLPRASICRIQRQGCTDIKSYSQHWTCLFPQHGPGMKHTRKIELTAWQTAIVEEHPQEFIRGLIHSDGCRVVNWTTRIVGGQPKRYEYPRYQFSQVSTDIQKLFTDALDQLGIEWRFAGARTISIARRPSVALMDTFVGPKH